MLQPKVWLSTLALSLTLAMPTIANSAELNIEFVDADSFTDIQPGNEHRQRYQDRILESFEELFTELADQLPDDQVLNIKVTDIDLAGNVLPVSRDGGMYMMRIVRHGQDPSIRFEYSLIDVNEQVLQEGEERLRGRTSADSIRQTPSAASSALSNERDMLERWFRDTFDVSR